MNLYLPITVIKRVDKKGCQMHYGQNHFLEKGIPRKNQEVRVWGYFINKSYTDCLVYRLTRIRDVYTNGIYVPARMQLFFTYFTQMQMAIWLPFII